MNKFLVLLLLISFSTFDQTKEAVMEDLSYEDKIAEKACECLSEKDSIPDDRQAVIKCIILATNEIHKEDIDKKYKRDFTVEGIRGLNKNVTDLLLKNCSVVSGE
jgi:hypothetical protein